MTVESPKKADGLPSNVKKVEVRPDHIGRLLLLSYREFERIALRILADLGFDDLRLPHLQILPHIAAGNIRTTDLAALANITKQAVAQLTVQLEQAGYLERFADPSDGRAKLLGLMPKGERLFAALPTVVARSEEAIREIVGEQEFTDMKRALRSIAQGSAPVQPSGKGTG
jgi:DNA-binding MarR family transcriptional regulator